MTRRCLVVVPGLVALGVERRSLRVQGSNRLREEEKQTISSFSRDRVWVNVVDAVVCLLMVVVKWCSLVITMGECLGPISVVRMSA